MLAHALVVLTERRLEEIASVVTTRKLLGCTRFPALPLGLALLRRAAGRQRLRLALALVVLAEGVLPLPVAFGSARPVCLALARGFTGWERLAFALAFVAVAKRHFPLGTLCSPRPVGFAFGGAFASREGLAFALALVSVAKRHLPHGAFRSARPVVLALGGGFANRKGLSLALALVPIAKWHLPLSAIFLPGHFSSHCRVDAQAGHGFCMQLHSPASLQKASWYLSQFKLQSLLSLQDGDELELGPKLVLFPVVVVDWEETDVDVQDVMLDFGEALLLADKAEGLLVGEVTEETVEEAEDSGTDSEEGLSSQAAPSCLFRIPSPSESESVSSNSTLVPSSHHW